MTFGTNVKERHISCVLVPIARSNDVRRAVLILRAGIDKEQLARPELAVGVAIDAVVENGAVRAGASDLGRAKHLLDRDGKNDGDLEPSLMVRRLCDQGAIWLLPALTGRIRRRAP